MSDDLIERLRHAHEHSQQRIVGSNIFQEAATALEAKDAEIERLAKRLDLLAVGFGVPDGGRYIADWQTRIDKFKAAESRAEQAEQVQRVALKEVADMARKLGEIERLRGALEIIAGERQCVDNFMSNADVARAALNGGHQQ